MTGHRGYFSVDTTPVPPRDPETTRRLSGITREYIRQRDLRDIRELFCPNHLIHLLIRNSAPGPLICDGWDFGGDA